MHQHPTVRGRAAFIRQKPTLFGGAQVIHDNSASRMASCRRWIIQVSAPSALDGRALASTMALTGNGQLGLDSGEGA